MRRGSADDAISLVQRLSEEKGGAPVLVAIDGHSAAGKSTLARTLQRLEAQLVSGDDFHRVMDEEKRFSLDTEEGYRRLYDWERLAAEVLGPLSNRQRARYRAYDWTTGALGDYREVTPYGTILVEGVYVARPELRGYYDAVLLVETPEQVREERQKRRCVRSGRSSVRTLQKRGSSAGKRRSVTILSSSSGLPTSSSQRRNSARTRSQ